jgi:hypothetical protein
MNVATAKPATWSDHNIFDLNSSHFDSYCFSIPHMMIPSECHLTLYDTVDCIANPLPLLDLLIVGQSDKWAKAMMHGDEGIGVDGLKELDPGPSSPDSMVTSWNMLRVTFTMNLYLHHLPHLTMSFLLSSKDIRHFLLSR